MIMLLLILIVLPGMWQLQRGPTQVGVYVADSKTTCCIAISDVICLSLQMMKASWKSFKQIKIQCPSLIFTVAAFLENSRLH